MHARLVVVAVAVAGCWSTRSTTPAIAPAPAPIGNAVYRPSRSALTLGQRCASSVGNAFDVARDELEKTGLSKQIVDEIQDALAASCEATVWADDTLECIGNITNIADWNPCQSQMTEEQKDDSTKRAVEIIQRRNAYGSGSGSGSATP